MAWLRLPAVRPDAEPADPSTGLSPLHRNLSLDLTAAVGLGSTMAVVGVLLPSIARREGLDAMGLAALAALPFLASLVTLFAGRIGPGTTGRMAALRSLGALSLLLVLVAPHPIFIALAIFGFWMAFALSAPLQQRIWALVYPTRERGRLLGLVGTGRSVAGALTLLAITLLAASSGWVAIIAAVAIGGALMSLAVARIEVPGIALGHRFGGLESIRVVTGEPMLRRVLSAQLLFGAGFLAAPAFIAMVHVDRLGLGIDDIALAGLVGYGSTAATIGLWGWIAGRLGALQTIAVGTLLGTFAIALMAVAPDFRIVLAATVAIGAAGASVDATWPLLIAEHAPADRQGEAAAGMNSVMALRGLFTPFLLMLPISMGLTDEAGGLAISALVMGSGAWVYARLSGLEARFVITLQRGGRWLRAQRKPAITAS